MSALTLKLIACISMLLDHIGFFNPSLPILRVIGRLAFPLYVFLLTEGFFHTSGRGRYALRLLLFAGISQPVFGWLFYGSAAALHGSVMITLLLAFVCLWVLESGRQAWPLRLLAWLFVLGLCLLCHLDLLPCDYGAIGILMAVGFYLVRRPASVLSAGTNAPERRCSDSLALCFCVFVSMFYAILLEDGWQLLRYAVKAPSSFQAPSLWTRIRAFSLLSVPLMVLYSGKKGWQPRSPAGRRAMQYGFYLFYPVHMLILALIYRV